MEKVIRILCLLLALLHFPCFSLSLPPSSHLCLPDQRAALLEFKSTISIDDDYCEVYPKTNSWNNKSINNDCCSWEGVSCSNVTGHVIGIDLSDSCLHGSILANNTLFHLQHLQWVDLSSNWLDGSVLANSSSLFQLQRLNLAHNHFNGPISSEFFSQFVSLTHLNLSCSGFSADLIPHQISFLSNLVSLDLSISSGSSDLFMRLDARGFDMLARNLTKLRTLVLSYVDMSCVSVTSFLNLTSSLEHLSLGFCQLHGEFPSEVFGFPSLQHIDLDRNKNLTGYIPKKNLTSSLKLLDLSSCGFRGSIPASFGNLTQITSIDLYGNSFGGQIPDVFGNLNKLTSLIFSSCNFSGQLPITMFSLTQITQLDLSCNQLSGEIPAVFNLTKISHLDLSYNHLEGSLQNHVSDQLQLLEVFLLSNNLVSGGVPSWLFSLPSLLKLDLSYNNLTGPIDRIQRPNSVHDVDLSSNDIHGLVPNSFFDLLYISSLNLSSNNLSGVIKSDMLSKLRSLNNLDLSNNRLLSLTTSNDDGNYDSFPELENVSLSSCNIRQFPSFFRTTGLKSLDLSNNKISGGISKWEAEGWEQLTTLNLSYNSLTTLEQFPGKKLEVLDLHSNLLQGPILSTCLNLQIPNPPQFLKAFFISENKLTGNIPSLICNWSLLIVLDLSRNRLSGTIPECLGNFSYSLEVMNLQMNNFYGQIPDSFINGRLRSVLLDDNQLEGPLPKSLSNCSSLEILNFGNNMLIGTFPDWLASLPSLQVLILGSNILHGSLPSSVFSALRILDLSGNEFTGSLPAKLIRNLTAMKDMSSRVPEPLELPRFEINIHRSTYHRGDQYDFYYQTSVRVRTKRSEIELVKTLAIFIAMDLSNNRFSGVIPEELGQLISLQMLNFSHNNFTGLIPSSLGNLAALESLDLSSNKLGGGIPSQLTNLTFLEALNLSENSLFGPIPNGNQFGTFDNDSYSGNLGLCGFPLSKQCGGNPGGPKPPAPKFKEDGDSGIAFIWKLAMMGYGCGVVLGFSIGYIVFATGKPWWFVRTVETDLQADVTRWIRRIQGKRN